MARLESVMRAEVTGVMTAAGASLHTLIEQRAVDTPEAIYAVGLETGSTIRYGELAVSCRRIGALFRTQGLRAGDTVSVVMPNGLLTLRVLLGVMHTGMVVNPVNCSRSRSRCAMCSATPIARQSAWRRQGRRGCGHC